jgi:putative endopeptidase
MRRRSLLSVAMLLTLTAAFDGAQAPPASSTAPSTTSTRAAAPAVRGVELASMDSPAGACTDFYQYACGGWMAANPMPPDRQRFGRFNQLQDQNFAILRRLVETPGGDADRRKASDYYAACMDEPGIEAKGLKPLETELARIAALSRTEDLAPLVAHLHSIGVNVLFRFGAQTDLKDASRQIAEVDQGGLGLPDRDYYLKTDARSLELKQKYEDHVQKMLAMLSTDSGAADRAAPGARAVLALETKLATAALDRVARRDPAATDHKMKKAAWEALTPPFDWAKYLAAAKAPAFDEINVAVPPFLAAMGGIVSSTPLADLKTYLTWQLVNASAPMLPRAFEHADFDFYSRTLGGQEQELPRWQRCITQTDEQLGEALGKAFVDEAFGPAAKANTLEMVERIKAAMKADIDAASWMSADTKRAAEVKLAAVADRI